MTQTLTLAHRDFNITTGDFKIVYRKTGKKWVKMGTFKEGKESLNK